MKINEAIDEAIEIIKGTQPFTFGRGKFADAVETLVDFAEWYRKQDLVQRGDCYASFRRASEEVCDICSTARGEVCDSCSVTEDLRIISKIPKAEPHCALCDYSAIDDYYLCAMCEYKDEKAEYRGGSDGKN